MTRQVTKNISRFSCATFAFGAVLTLNEGLANAQSSREELRRVEAVQVQTLTPQINGTRIDFNYENNSVTSYALAPRGTPPALPSFTFQIPPGTATVRFRFYPLVRQRRHSEDVPYSLNYEVDGAQNTTSGQTQPTQTPDPLTEPRRLRIGTPMDFQLTLNSGSHTIRFGSTNPNGLVQMVTADFTSEPVVIAPQPPPSPPVVIAPPPPVVIRTPPVVVPPAVPLDLGSSVSINSGVRIIPDFFNATLAGSYLFRIRRNTGLLVGAGAVYDALSVTTPNRDVSVSNLAPFGSVGLRLRFGSNLFSAQVFAGASVLSVSENNSAPNQGEVLPLFGGSVSYRGRFVYANASGSNAPFNPLNIEIGTPIIPSWVRDAKISVGLSYSLVNTPSISGRTLDLTNPDHLVGVSASVPIYRIGRVLPSLTVNGGYLLGEGEFSFGAGVQVQVN